MKLIEKTYINGERVERVETLVDLEKLRELLPKIYREYSPLDYEIKCNNNIIEVKKDMGDANFQLYKEFVLVDENEIA